MKKYTLYSFIAFLIAGVLRAGEPATQLPPNARLAIIGDSITEQKIYSKKMITCFWYFGPDIKSDPKLAAAVEVVKRRAMNSQEKLDAAARALLVPVEHKIRVEIVNQNNAVK